MRKEEKLERDEKPLRGEKPLKHKIEILFWRECPSWELALRRVQNCARELENEKRKFEVVLREVRTDEEAQKLGFRGSPTILVDGKDIDPEGAEQNIVGLSCRVYRVEGKFLPLPPESFIKRKILEIVEGETTEKPKADSKRS